MKSTFFKILTSAAAVLISLSSSGSSASPTSKQKNLHPEVIEPDKWSWIPRWSPDGQIIAVTWPRSIPVTKPAVKTGASGESTEMVWAPTPPSLNKISSSEAPTYFVDNTENQRTSFISAATFKPLSGTISEPLRRIYWAPNSKLIAGEALMGPTLIYEVESGKPFMEIAHDATGALPSISWSPDSNRIASMSRERGLSVYTIPNKVADFAVKTLGCSGDCQVAWSPDGAKIAATGAQGNSYEPNTIKIFNATTGQIIFEAISNEHIRGVSWSEDKQWLAYADKSLHIISAETLKEVKLFAPAGRRECIWFDWSPTGAKIAYTGIAGHLNIYDMQGGRETADLLAEKSELFGFNWSPDNNYMALDDHDTVAICRIADGQYLGYKEFSDIPIVQWSPDGRAIALTCFSQGKVFWVPIDFNNPIALEGGRAGNPWLNQKLPADLNDCFTALNDLLSSEVKERIKKSSNSDLCLFTGGPSLGMQLRNTWRLRGSNALTDYFNKHGITDGAQMSTIIIECYWHKLNGRDVKIDELESWRARLKQ
jgi:WD40 repeat protein